MHEEVIQRMFTKTDANQKRIAKNIYDGLNNSMLMIDEALLRLENPGTKYKTEAKFLKDASYAIIGQIYRQSKHLPKIPPPARMKVLRHGVQKLCQAKNLRIL